MLGTLLSLQVVTLSWLQVLLDLLAEYVFWPSNESSLSNFELVCLVLFSVVSIFFWQISSPLGRPKPKAPALAAEWMDAWSALVRHSMKSHCREIQHLSCIHPHNSCRWSQSCKKIYSKICYLKNMFFNFHGKATAIRAHRTETKPPDYVSNRIQSARQLPSTQPEKNISHI